MRSITILSPILFLTITASATSEAEPAQRRTGFELLVDTTGPAHYDRPYRLRGVAFEVLGLAQLNPLPGARVRARCEGAAWSETLSGYRGTFELDIQIPASPSLNGVAMNRIEVEIHENNGSREFSVPMTFTSPIAITARTDRQTYEPGETVHVWARIFDVRTRRPLEGIPVEFDLNGPPIRRSSSSAGVVSVDIPLVNAQDGAHYSLFVTAGTRNVTAESSLSFRVAPRPTTDMLVTLEASPEVVSPGETVNVLVRVRAPSGFPVRGAQVSLTASNQSSTATTDGNGEATIEIRAPAYSGTARGRVAISGTVRHPGYGVAGVSGEFGITPPRSLDIEAIAIHGGLVPEVRDRLLLSVFQSDGVSPATGQRVEVSGAAIEGGRATTTVDRHGFLAVPVRVSASSFARHVGESACSGQSATTIDVAVHGDVEQHAQLCVPVLENALIMPTIRQPAIAPGEVIEVSLQRRPEVARRPAVVELLSATYNGSLELIRSVTVPPSTTVVRFNAPDDRIGVFVVEARPLLGEAQRAALGFAEGWGASESILVRPEVPTFPRLDLDREQYTIGGEAELTIHTPATTPSSHVAILVRDLAQHQGEQAYAEYFLHRAFERAILDPTTPSSDLLLRAALAGWTTPNMPSTAPYDDDPGPILARDPIGLADDLVNQQLGTWMVSVERILEEALQSSTVDDITTGSGARRHFQATIVERAVSPHIKTLGNGRVTTEMLTRVDPSFTYESVARRIARRRIVMLLSVLSSYIDPDGSPQDRPRGHSTEPPERWISELVRLGLIAPTDLHDPWGGTFVLRRTGRQPAFTIAVEAEGYELVSPGPDGQLNTADDVRDPFARVVDEGSIYAQASGEDLLIAELSALSPGSTVLQDLLEAYQRLTDEALEELAGDFLGASGSGGGAGYGVGAGGLRGRRARAPSIRMGHAAVNGFLGGGGVVREDFPATLFFEPESTINPAGHTTIDIPLADAPTTYIVEAILWRDDGWVWSSSTRIRVDMELIVDAPVPRVVTEGDNISLPLRVANRTKNARTVWLSVTGTKTLGLQPIEAGPVEVPPEDAVEVPVRVSLRRPAEGQLTIAAHQKNGDPLDVVRRSLSVRPNKRRAQDRHEDIFYRQGTLTATTPQGATPLHRNRISATVGPAIFGQHGYIWQLWLHGFVGIEEQLQATLLREELRRLQTEEDPIELGQLIGALWPHSFVTASRLHFPLSVLEHHVEGIEPENGQDLRQLSRLLMLLSPALQTAEERGDLGERLLQLARNLRIKIESGAALFADAPWLSARAAAALLWTARPRDAEARAIELLDRARAALVSVDEDLWLEGGEDDEGDELFVASSFLALCELHQGRQDIAFHLVRSLARLLRSSGGDLPEVRHLRPEDLIMAAAATALLGDRRRASSIMLHVDGSRHILELENGIGSLAVRSLGAAGEHRIELDVEHEVVLLEVDTEYLVDWDVPPPLVGPFAISISGEAGQQDHRSGLVLTVRNRVPRLVGESVVEVMLPAGVEIDEEARRQLQRSTGSDPDVSGETLTLRLGPMGPRRSTSIALPWLWTTAGQLTGLGVMGHSIDRPEALSIAPSRQVDVGTSNGGTP